MSQHNLSFPFFRSFPPKKSEMQQQTGRILRQSALARHRVVAPALGQQSDPDQQLQQQAGALGPVGHRVSRSRATVQVQ